MPEKPAIVWFRADLRLGDNPALDAAARSDSPVIPVFVLPCDGLLAPGGAQRWWLHHSLLALKSHLEKAGSSLVLLKGDERAVIADLVERTGAGAVYWNRRYAPQHIETDRALKQMLTASAVSVETFNGSLWRDPWEVKTKSGGDYRVFKPFWKSLRAKGPARARLFSAPSKMRPPSQWPKSDDLSSWRLTPESPDWAHEFADHWAPGEEGAAKRLETFLDDANCYANERDMPAMDATSRLSPHLAHGEISVTEIWCRVRARVDLGELSSANAEKFLSELAWREFSYNLLFHNSEIARAPLRKEFERFDWREDDKSFNAWARGMTGVPIVDAGLRQLWRTGWMHNRVRMIVASFLVKNLLIHWTKGERWFWDSLVDADAANNPASWQWVAGSGADAAPYFRIFNPVSQGEKHDPEADYVREFVPEIAALPNKWIHKPWSAPDEILSNSHIVLGKTYPFPIVDLHGSRQRALDAYQKLKQS
ncbi:MAG: deoxyribodipyrimidine photo-lyase [Parvularculaceae bacterium]